MRSSPEATVRVELPKPKSVRIASLDWARGAMLIASVLVNSLIVTPAWFDHAKWSGIHPVDIIFPMFVTLSGCGLAFAMHRKVKVKPLARRFVILLLVGLVYNAIVEWSVDVWTWRITGVLQLYAVLVALMGVLHLVTRSWRGWAVLTLLFACAHTLALGLYSRSCPSGILTRVCNPSGPLDSLIFGANHIYAEGVAGHDPEGIVAILGAMVSAAAGATVGHLMLSLTSARHGTRSWPRAVVALSLTAAGFLILVFMLRLLAAVFGFEFLFAKRIWTAPFALVVAAGTTMLLLLGHLLLDRVGASPRLERASFPLISLGRNSLLVYFGSHILTTLLGRSFGGASLSMRYFDAMGGTILAQVGWSLALLAFWTTLAVALHRRGIYLRP